MTARAKADELRRLHLEPAILVIVNVWDAASARTVAAVPGCRAIAAASWASSDAEAVGREPALAAIERIADAATVPVTADLEGVCGDSAEDVADTVARAVAAGAVGCNLEDGVPGATVLRDAEEASARIAAAREAGARAGVPLVINARTDAFLRGTDDLEAAVLRGRAYARAGADCIFVPGAQDAATIRALVEQIDAPVSVLARPGGPSVRELQELGVARVSFGRAPMGVALAALARAASDLQAA